MIVARHRINPPPPLSNDVRTRNRESRIEYSNHGEKKERKKEKLLRRINETGGGIPVDEERRRRGEGGARVLEGERARKRGLQEFNLDEFFLATYYRMGSRETLV